MSALKKPPLGVMPRKLWLEHRAQELSRAIQICVQERRYDPVGEWIVELQGVVEELEGMEMTVPSAPEEET